MSAADFATIRERFLERRREIEALTDKMGPEVAAKYFEQVDADLAALARVEADMLTPEEARRCLRGIDEAGIAWKTGTAADAQDHMALVGKLERIAGEQT